MSESGNTTSSNDNASDEQLYECRHCPGLTFTEAEKDTHRAQHRRNRRSRGRSQSPNASVISFHLVGEGKKGSKRKKDNKQDDEADKAKKARRKRGRSRKQYDKDVKKERLKSG